MHVVCQCLNDLRNSCYLLKYINKLLIQGGALVTAKRALCAAVEPVFRMGFYAGAIGGIAVRIASMPVIRICHDWRITCNVNAR